MNISPIRTEKDYRLALRRVDQLIALDPVENTPEYDELDIISTLVEVYEDVHYPIESPDPVDAVKYIMQEKGLNQKDLVVYFGGSKSLVSDFLNRKRQLSKNVIKSLHDGLGLPYEILMA